MKKQLTNIMLVLMLLVTTIGYASNEPKKPVKTVSTDIPIINKSTGAFLFTTGQMLTASTAADWATKTERFTYTSFVFRMQGVRGILHLAGYKTDTPSVYVNIAVVLNDNGTTWGLPEAYIADDGWVRICTSASCTSCYYDFGLRSCTDCTYPIEGNPVCHMADFPGSAFGGRFYTNLSAY